jgi:hypothetical protein
MSSEADEHQEGPAPKRGEAAWKEAKERVAERNQRARKAGKQRREAYERGQENARRAAETRRNASLLARRRTP